jgi:tetrahydromethanopterin S-methyltransferase subunit H
MYLVRAGEKLYLDADLEALAKGEQREAMEQDEREGLVREYLDRLLPDNWDGMDIHARQDYIRSTDDPTLPVGTVKRNTVSNMEIFCEYFGKRKEDIKPADSYVIASIMERIDGWKKQSGQYRQTKIYGRQRVYTRENR